MFLSEPLHKAINSEKKIRLLRFLLSGKPIPDMSERELAKIVKMPNVSVNRILSSFSELHLVHWRGVGHSHVWSVNKESLAYGVLKKVVDAIALAGTPVESLKNELINETKKLPIIRMALFGSVARGEERSGSDIDLFVLVGDVKAKKRVDEKFEEIGDKILVSYGNVLMPYILTENEYRMKKGLGVIKNIEKEGVWLV